MPAKSSDTQIWYIYHSGFAVKTTKHFLIFDYYRDNPEFSFNELLDEMQDLEIVVFASHGHGDHFNAGIFDWKGMNIQYVLSSDIEPELELGTRRKDVTLVRPGHKYQLPGIGIDVLDSTDLGVSFLVECDGVKIFHAGDLNWWHWEGERDEDNNAMAEKFKGQIDLLKGMEIDIAFIPVDPRLEEHYSLGVIYFMQVAGANMVIPMHFGKDYSIFPRLKKDLSSGQIKCIVEITPLDWQYTYEKG